MKKIDVFDFDKTLYLRDSTVDFYLFCLKKKKSILKYLPKQFWGFLLYKLKIKPKEYFKERFFSFLKSLENVDSEVEQFWKTRKENFRKDLLEKTNNYKIVISASPEFLLEKICEYLGIDYCIATKVDKHTGKFLSKKCYGEEKVKRLNEFMSGYEIENFYSDSTSDKPLAVLAKHSYLIRN